MIIKNLLKNIAMTNIIINKKQKNKVMIFITHKKKRKIVKRIY